jgi:hypothetical protein
VLCELGLLLELQFFSSLVCLLVSYCFSAMGSVGIDPQKRDKLLPDAEQPVNEIVGLARRDYLVVQHSRCCVSCLSVRS